MIRRTHALLILVGLLGLSLAGAARGQMPAAGPYEVEVTAPSVQVRCGWRSDGWYSVGEAPRGTRLTVDGAEGEWLRVRYPEGLGFGVLLRADEVEIRAGVATLTSPARPIFRNRASPATGSWMKMPGEVFAPGTEFEVVEELGEGSGLVLVEAPDRARGYVLASGVTRVAPEDAGADDAAEDEGATDRDDREAAASDDAERAAADDDAPAEAGVASGEDAAEADGGEAAGEEGDAEGDGAAEEEPTERAAPTPEQLYAAYRRVVDQPIEGAELAPLIAEFEAAIGRTETGSADAQRLGARLELLEIRRELQRDLSDVETASGRAAREREAINRLIVDWRSRPAYSVVGRLMASALYDGRRLPLMYRLQSLDGPGGRTIAYLLPSDELDLNAKVGAVVGVVGDTRRDRTISARLVEPELVDVLEPGG